MGYPTTRHIYHPSILPLHDTMSESSILTMPYQPYDTPKAEPLQSRERSEVNRYRALRDRFQNGPYYAAVNAASTSAKQGTKERAEFDPFNGMPSYSSRYQKRKRTVPKIAGREYSESSVLVEVIFGNGEINNA